MHSSSNLRPPFPNTKSSSMTDVYRNLNMSWNSFCVGEVTDFWLMGGARGIAWKWLRIVWWQLAWNSLSLIGRVSLEFCVGSSVPLCDGVIPDGRGAYTLDRRSAPLRGQRQTSERRGGDEREARSSGVTGWQRDRRQTGSAT